MAQLTTGTFYDAQTANRAVNAIIAMDYPRDRINVILSRQTRQRFWDTASRDREAASPPGDGTDSVGFRRALDALTHLGFPRGDAERLRNDIRSGGIVVGVGTSNGDGAVVERVMRNNDARDVMENKTTPAGLGVGSS